MCLIPFIYQNGFIYIYIYIYIYIHAYTYMFVMSFVN